MRNRPHVLVFAALLLASAAPLPAADEQPEPPAEDTTLLGRIDDKMARIRLNLRTTQAKFRRNVTDSLPPGFEGTPTPIERCCHTAIKRVRSRSSEMDAIVRELGECYQRESNPDGISALGFFHQDHKQFDSGVDRLVSTNNASNVEGVWQSLTRAYILLSRTRDTLHPCPAANEPEKPEAPTDNGDQ